MKKQPTLGILGGGQLGRMSAQAAKKLNIQVIIFTPEKHSPAEQVAEGTIVANYDDKEALTDFANRVDFISYEFENIPVETIRFLKNIKPVFPDDNLLEITQHRVKEKTFLNEAGIKTSEFTPISTIDELKNAVKKGENDRFVLKTCRFGYDGKGQVFLSGGDDLEEKFSSLKSDDLILEAYVPYDYEISVVIARDSKGNTETYGPMINYHDNHILRTTIAPAPIPDKISSQAIETTEKLAKSIGLCGVLALEMFVTKDGEILANEIAPRTHNSGHWTIDACEVSQFENHVRTVCGLPVAAPKQHSKAEMTNLLGEEILHLDKYANAANTFIHPYGKTDVRKGRKMGHVTVISPFET